NTQNGLQPADFFPDVDDCPNAIVYVGQASIGGEQNGGFGAPYSQLGYAIEQAGPNGCVVVMPGEYVTPLYINKPLGLGLYAYDLVTGETYPETIFRVVGQYDNGTYTTGAGNYVTNFPNVGGLYVTNSSNITISGFRIIGSRAYGSVLARQAITFHNTDNVNISNNIFTGWSTNIGTPVQILGGDSISILDNEFTGNTGGLQANGSLYSPSIIISDAGGTQDGASYDRVLVQENTFENNTPSADVGSSRLWPSVLFTQGSNTDIIGNAFVGNRSGTVVSASTDNAADTTEVRIVSNLFLNNDGTITDGPLVHAYYVSNLSFMNNTVVRNERTGNGALIARGARTGSAGSSGGATQNFDFFNNLVDGNTFGGGLFRVPGVSVTTCNALGATGTGAATQFNWWDDSSAVGACSDEMGTALAPTNSNIVDAADDPTDDFIGQVNTGLNRDTDVVYYSLRQFDEEPVTPIYSLGIDYSNITAGTDVDLSQQPFTRGILDQVRTVDVENWEQGNNPDTGSYLIDLGAFEYNELDIVIDVYSHKTPNTFITPPEPAFFEPLADYPEDSSQIVINLDDVVQGGFGDLTFTLLTSPDNYGTHCGSRYGTGNKGAFITQSTGGVRLFYCPPRDFYTDTTPRSVTPGDASDPDIDQFPGLGLDKGTGLYEYCEDEATQVTSPSYSCTLEPGVIAWPDYLIFTYTVIDEAGVSDTGAILLRITGEDDPALTAVIGDESPATDIYRVTGNIGTTINVRLRPYVLFNNFSFSETNNAEFGTLGAYQIDYPFSYGTPTIFSDPDGIIDTIDDSNLATTGQVSITLTDNIGEAEVRYSVQDADGNSVTNRLKLVSVSRIPTNPGIYDDSSFAFDYSDETGDLPGAWDAINSANNINNTLHNSRGIGDVANFGLKGTGFVLYMQGQGRGSFWDLEIDGEIVTDWTLLTDSTSVYQS
ncbi:MAG: hypothetical protein KC496_04195, partial [Anaerolineae bacterium]|nr:hypothetical protein [Anaerolineae bacterium]